jgi:regulator of sigma E protease
MDIAASLWDIGLGALTFLLVITVLVAVHELGHFWFARLFGMEVKAFAVMMGGIRKTDLTSRLSKPLLPAWVLLVSCGLALGVLMGGAALKNQPLEMTGLIFLAIPLPVWVVWRLEQLYHLTPFSGMKSLFYSYVGGLLLTMMGTRGEGLTPGLFFGVLIASGMVGILLVYYKPLNNKPEDSEMGEGHIMDSSGESVPVRFRPLLWFTDKKGTEFSLLLLPLGGFAAIKGMHAKEDGSEIHIQNGFYSRPAWQRLIVLFAGPLFSILFGVIILAGVYSTYGRQSDIPTNKVGAVQGGSPAEKGGLKPGDEILKVNGQPTPGFFELVAALRDRVATDGKVTTGVPTSVELLRNGSPLTLTITPRVSKEPKPVVDLKGEPTGERRRQAELGIAPMSAYEQLPLGAAVVEASLAPVVLLQNLGSLLSRPETAGDAIGGPITIAQASTSAAKQGLQSVLMMAALLSITLGIMNLLPIPPLDGGQMVVAFIEMLRGEKRLGISLQQGLSMIGLLFVVGLTLAAFAVDIGRQAQKNKEEVPSVSQKP